MLIDRYIIRNTATYLILATVLLTVVLFSQQLARFADILVSARPTTGLMARLVFGVILNIATLALPIATLAGILIGLSQMQADSELTAMRAAGVGNLRLLAPILLLGFLVSGLALFINLELAPKAAESIRAAGLTAALNKLDSPVEPKVFAVDIPNYVVYVRKGDVEQGKWQQVFIFTQNKSGTRQIVTAKSGGIDTAVEQSELVLDDAVMTTIPQDGDPSSTGYVAEHLDRFRFVMDTGRKALVDRLRSDDQELDELTWVELRDKMASADPKESREAGMLFHRRLAFSLVPIVFALLGTALGLRIRRGGRGRGGIVSLAIIATYYLATVFFEQQARIGKLPAMVGAWAPPLLFLAVGFGLLFFRGFTTPWQLKRTTPDRSSGADLVGVAKRPSIRRRPGYVSYLTSFPALLDRHIWKQLLLMVLFSTLALCSVFAIFTVFEMWRFVAVSTGGWPMMGKYLLFLMPFVLVQVLPLSLLISSLTVYALLARRSEAIAWLVGGQSLYRLILPGIVVALATGYGLWRIQEYAMPAANLRQDTLRAQLRGKIIQTPQPFGGRWAASADSNTLFSFENGPTEGSLVHPTVYEFDPQGIHLTRITSADSGQTTPTGIKLTGIKTATFEQGQVHVQRIDNFSLSQPDAQQIFKQSLERASYVNASALSTYIKSAQSRGEQVGDLQLELYRKYSTPALPVVMALIGMPLALLVGRKSVMTAALLSVAIGLAYWGLAGLAKQLNTYGLISPKIAAWVPVALFLAIGIYLVSRLRS